MAVEIPVRKIAVLFREEHSGKFLGEFKSGWCAGRTFPGIAQEGKSLAAEIDVSRVQSRKAGRLGMPLGNFRLPARIQGAAPRFKNPLANHVTANDENKALLLRFLGKHKPSKLRMLKIHNLARKKHESLKKPVPTFADVPCEYINDLNAQIERAGVKVELLSI